MTVDRILAAATTLGAFWANQIGGTFFAAGSALSLASLLCTVLLAAFLAVPRGRSAMPRLKVWRRALFPRRLWRSASGRADLGYFAFSLLGSGLVLGWALLSGSALAAAVGQRLIALLGPTPPPFPPIVASALLTAGLFLAYEFAYWLDHWLSHRIPLLWQFHRVHHAAESLSLLTNFRVHPVDTIVFANIVAVVLGLVGGALGWLLGATAQAWTIGGTNGLILLSAVVLTHLQHSHLWITFGARWGRHLLSPAHHQVHHSADPRHFDRNFGSTLAVYDRLFGTLHVPGETREALRFGLDGALPDPHGWRAQLVTPFMDAARLMRWPKRRPVAAAE